MSDHEILKSGWDRQVYCQTPKHVTKPPVPKNVVISITLIPDLKTSADKMQNLWIVPENAHFYSVLEIPDEIDFTGYTIIICRMIKK